MSESPRLVQVGVADPTGFANPIFADVISLGSAVRVSVTLTAAYAMFNPVGYPFRPAFTGAEVMQYPHTLNSGTTLKVLACEASALIAAGAAVAA